MPTDNFLERLAKAIATHFGTQCEVVVHDVSQGYENSIVVIENGHVTQRKVGDGASEIVLKALQNETVLEDELNYLTRTADGKILKSSTIYIKDDDKKIVGIFSINFNITDLLLADSAIGSLLSHDKKEDVKDIDTIPSSVHQLLDSLLGESCEYVGKPADVMNKDDKVRAIQFLEERGAFLIKKSGDKVANYFNISKYTLYNYLDVPRNV